MPDMIANMIGSWLAVSFLLWFFFFAYRRYRIGVLRHHLFAVRDRLFERAKGGDLSFDDRAYGMTRSLINGVLNSADTLSLMSMVVCWGTASFWRHDDVHGWTDERFKRARKALSRHGRAAVDAALTEVHFCILSHVAHVSVFLSPVMHAVKIWLWCTGRHTTKWAAQLAEAKRRMDLSKTLSAPLEAWDREAHRLAYFKEGALAEAA